jgi:hypothetical protein
MWVYASIITGNAITHSKKPIFVVDWHLTLTVPNRIIIALPNDHHSECYILTSKLSLDFYCVQRLTVNFQIPNVIAPTLRSAAIWFAVPSSTWLSEKPCVQPANKLICVSTPKRSRTMQQDCQFLVKFFINKSTQHVLIVTYQHPRVPSWGKHVTKFKLIPICPRKDSIQTRTLHLPFPRVKPSVT